jgi:hypothetical protein
MSPPKNVVVPAVDQQIGRNSHLAGPAFSHRGGTGGEKYGQGRYGNQANPFEAYLFSFFTSFVWEVPGKGIRLPQSSTQRIDQNPALSVGHSVRSALAPL